MTNLKTYQMYVDGNRVDAENGETFESMNPATGQAWASIPAASEADVDCAVKAAHRAFTEGPWSTMLPTERGVLLRQLAEAMKEHSEELGRTETVDTGKLFSETRWQASECTSVFPRQPVRAPHPLSLRRTCRVPGRFPRRVARHGLRSPSAPSDKPRIVP